MHTFWFSNNLTDIKRVISYIECLPKITWVQKALPKKKLMITQEGVSEAPNQSNPVTGYYGN